MPDERDQQVLQLARKWMGIEPWPEDPAGQEIARQSWRCQRTACSYHAQFCRHGARKAG